MPETLEHSFKFSKSEKIPVRSLTHSQTSAFSNSNADFCIVDLSPKTRVLLFLFPFTISFRNHLRPSEVHGPRVICLPRHKHVLHSLNSLVQLGRQAESVFGPSLWPATIQLHPFYLIFYLNEVPLWQTREDLQRGVEYLCSSSQHLYHTGTVSCRKHQSPRYFASFASNHLLVSAEHTPGVRMGSSWYNTHWALSSIL